MSKEITISLDFLKEMSYRWNDHMRRMYIKCVENEKFFLRDEKGKVFVARLHEDIVSLFVQVDTSKDENVKNLAKWVARCGSYNMFFPTTSLSGNHDFFMQKINAISWDTLFEHYEYYGAFESEHTPPVVEKGEIIFSSESTSDFRDNLSALIVVSYQEKLHMCHYYGTNMSMFEKSTFDNIPGMFDVAREETKRLALAAKLSGEEVKSLETEVLYGDVVLLISRWPAKKDRVATLAPPSKSVKNLACLRWFGDWDSHRDGYTSYHGASYRVVVRKK